MAFKIKLNTQTIRLFIAISVMTVIALIHAFRLGSYLNAGLRIYYYSYASDIILPFGVYLFLCFYELRYRFLRSWVAKTTFVLGFCIIVEILQFLNIPFLGTTFDFFDFIAYCIGVAIGIFFDKLLFEKLVPFWKYDKNYF